ncbi:exonuclease domain-containing protein [Microvirga sp. Mcv34]|uniref:exonuclease domain-containing protein n=1 Tax=Microvirga sp. Mcv34 TaxID=2926016 RepID=UPI0021C60F68|nr:exonuclease domain-containing protein [Microvirga sp. Mcv34]
MKEMLLRLVDFETTGTPPDAAICEVGFRDVLFKDGEAKIDRGFGMLVNPGRPIPPEAMAVHHIRDHEVKFAPPVDRGFRLLMDDTPDIFVAHNASFEREFFAGGSIPWICTLKAARRVWPEAPGHSNGVLRYWLDCDSAADFDDALAMPPHRAAPDAYVTAHILVELLKVATIEEMIAWTAEPSLLPKINFGKHRGKKWTEVPRDYLEWILRQEMDEDTKHTARHYLNGGEAP